MKTGARTGRYLWGAALLSLSVGMPTGILAPAAQARAAGSFTLVAAGRAPTIFVDLKDATVVSIAAKAFAGDVQSVSGVLPAVENGAPAGCIRRGRGV